MTRKQTRQYEMLQRVSTFGQAHRTLFPSDSVGGQAFDTLAASVRRLSEQAVSKRTSARGGSGSRRAAREDLLHRLETVRRGARGIALDIPGFDDPFREPPPRSDQGLLTTGRAFVTAAEAAKDRFVAYGMPESFLTTLRAQVDAFEQGAMAREVGRDHHTAARAGIDEALADALGRVRRLDYIVASRVQDDPVTLAVWKRDRRIEVGRRVRRSAPPTNESSGALPTTASTARGTREVTP